MIRTPRIRAMIWVASLGLMIFARDTGIANEAAPLAVQLQFARVDKVLYEPGQAGVFEVGLRNTSIQTVEVTLRVLLESGLNQQRVLQETPLKLERGESRTLTVPFTAAGYWGYEIRAEVVQPKGIARASDYFSVSDKLWDVGIGFATPIMTQSAAEMRRTLSLPAQMRRQYSNWVDLFFWAPCDWSKQTPTGLDQWWSGQTMYAHSETGLTAFVSACHENGIRVASYANGNPSGPYAFEVARQHPQWFGGPRNIHAPAERLDLWNDPTWEGRPENSQKLGWQVIKPDFKQLAAVDYGIDQLIAGAKHYKFDAIRFDGQYTVGSAALSTRNMRHLKERVYHEKPGLKLGFNWGRAPEWNQGYTHELREAMAGDGLYMQEGIRHLQYTDATYQSWEHYIDNELRIAKRIQTLGGYYHCIWLLNLHNDKAKAYYILVYGLIAGAHPAYGSQNYAPGCENWGAFLTRWSEVLWDRNLHKLDDPDALATVTLVAEDAKAREARETEAVMASLEDTLLNGKGGTPDTLAAPSLTLNVPKAVSNTHRLQWRNMVQERIVSKTKKQLILHLVMAPHSDTIKEVKLPDPCHGTLEVTFKKQAGMSSKVLVLRPEQPGFSSVVDLENDGLTIAKPGNWTIVVLEITGDYDVPVAPPLYTEKPDLGVEEEERAIALDPNKTAVEESDASSKFVYKGLDFDRLLNSGSANIGACTVSDPNSPLGTVQGRAKDSKKQRMGMWWIGTPHPARYSLSVRLKWTDEKETPTPQTLKITWKSHADDGLNKPGIVTTFVTPGHPNPPEGAIVLKERGEYHNYPLGEMDMWPTGGCYNFVADAQTEAAGDNQIFMERLIFKTITQFGDLDVLEKFPEQFEDTKPAGLRQPNGANPQKILFVRGLFWQPYLTGIELPMASAYALGSYEDVYAYDAIVLANISKVDRKMLRDFINDGGRVVWLGGPDTFTAQMTNKSFLSDLLPVDFAADLSIVPAQKPMPLKLDDKEAASAGGHVLWYHPSTPRSGSTVIAYAGDQSIAVKRPYGKGVCVVFTGTVLGQEIDKELPFWKSPTWKTLLDAMLHN